MADKNETVAQKLNNAIEVAGKRIFAVTGPDEMQKASQAVLNLMQAKSMFATFDRPAHDLNDELKYLLDRIRHNLSPDQMMKAAQAVLNMMHAKAHWEALHQAVNQANKPPKEKAG